MNRNVEQWQVTKRAVSSEAGVVASGPAPVDPPLAGEAPEWHATELRRGPSGSGEEEVVVLSLRAPAEAPAVMGDFVSRDGAPPRS